jgi:hypothetical protein
MNTIRKLRPQPKLAHLSEEEREQIAEWLKTDTYETVLERIAKPRPDGFDTHASIKVLQTLRERAALAEALSEHAEERLAVDDLLALLNGEPVAWHEATLHLAQKAAFKLSLQDQSATMLLNLVRIANNPFHRQLAQEKLDLQKRALALRETRFANIEQARAAQSQPEQQQEDDLGPFARNLDEIEIRAFRKFGIPEDQWEARRALNRKHEAELEKQIREYSAQPTQSSLQDPACVSSTAQPPASESKIENQESKIDPADHMRRRYLSFVKPDPNNPIPRDDSWRLECPCGNPHPCPEHEPLPDWVNDINPCSADFYEQLQKRGIPYTYPILNDSTM